MDNPERLISDYLDEVLPPDEVTILFQWIHGHPDNARRFAGAAFLHRRLQHRLSSMRRLEEDADLSGAGLFDAPLQDAAFPSEPATRAPSHTPPAPVSLLSTRAGYSMWRHLGAVAAILLLIVGVLAVMVWPRHAPARLVAAERASWTSDAAPPKEGDRLPKRTLSLDSGMVRIAFDDGNALIIEGPARFAITDPGTVRLDQGTLTAIVTVAGRGFRVITPTAQVTDLGTEFGVQASASGARVAVFNGTVRVEGSGGKGVPQEVNAGSEVEVSTAGITPLPFAPTAYKRVMPSDPLPLDLVDLLADGNGTGSAVGGGIDAATGRARQTQAVAIRIGNRQYNRVNDHRVLDGCFIPGGRMEVDSSGHHFTFPTTTLISYGLIWAGPTVPWAGDLPIATTLPQDAGRTTDRVLVMHSNNGLTLDLNAIRELHTSAKITGFRTRVGNSYRPAGPATASTRPLATIHVIVDGVARFEKRAFANDDQPINVSCILTDKDRFLTLATTDGGDGNVCDWILWTLPELVLQSGPR